MTKQELASYCASLLSLMESKEDAGVARGATLGNEYTFHYKMMMDIVRKEHEDARKREDGPSGDEAGTDLSRDRPSSYSPDRDRPVGQVVRPERGPRVQSPGDFVKRP